MTTIYILTHYDKRTGGPEACHQLSDALIEQGFDVRTVYYDLDQVSRGIMHVSHKERPKQGGLSFGIRGNVIPEFERYRVNPVAAAPDHPDAIIVIPEGVAHLAAFYEQATVLVWWLSVDNAFGSLAITDDNERRVYAGINLARLRRPNVRHAYQSGYARNFLEALRFRPNHPLSDYTSSMRDLATPLPFGERLPLVLFGTRKVTVDLQPIFDEVNALAQSPSISCIALHEMPRAHVAELLARARVYVDLGSFPGKDRMPREAVDMGCNVIVADQGAGHTDFPSAHVPGGFTLAERIVQATKAQWPPVAIDPELERKQFNDEVRALFSEL